VARIENYSPGHVVVDGVELNREPDPSVIEALHLTC
jgi:hypothetical protein